MKIIGFSATAVHGCYNFDIEFMPDINFLLGINGSGKTTVLRLMQAILSMDFSVLQSIRFKNMELIVERNQKQMAIAIANEKNSLTIWFNGTQSESKVRTLSDEERNLFLKSDRLDEHFEEARFIFLRSLDTAARSFVDGERPLFLGLERRTNRYDEELSFEEARLGIYRNRIIREKEGIDGLENCTKIIERAYRQYRKISDSANSKVVNVLIASTFDYIDFDEHSFPMNHRNSFLELEELLSRRNELERFAFSFGEGTLFGEIVEKFFIKIRALLNRDESERNDGGFAIELLMNKVQIKRFQKIFAELDKQKKHSERAYAPIKTFIQSMNRFFATSQKQVEIDSIGRVQISQNGEAIPLQALSSGEKQLIILMANAIFSRNKGGIFIIDEPEVSLHMKWQEMLVDELTRGNKNNQFIFATHSPEIVGYLKENCIQVR